jgi:hypothetical protein
MEDGNRNFQLPFGKKIQPMFKSSLLSHKISGTMVEKVVDNAGAEEDTVLVHKPFRMLFPDASMFLENKH